MIKCKNRFCKYHCNDNKCELKNSYIGIDSKCENFEKGFLYYFYYFSYELDNKNFISTFNMSDTMRYSIYYLMKVLPIEFSYDDLRGIITLREIGTDKLLNANDIYKMIQSDKLDSEELNKCFKDFEENGLPKQNNDEPKKEMINHDYGWLSPLGDFIEAPWGEHEEAAEKIINTKNWGDEYNEWLDSQPNKNNFINFRDFLVDVKGYALIHDPSTLGYNVTHRKELTKKQKDFLYGYFIDMGMTLKAEKYLND